MKTATPIQFNSLDRRVVSAKLSGVKKKLVRRFSAEFSDRIPIAVIHRAIDEADELAHNTGFPHLVLPLLAEETVRRVSRIASTEAPYSEAVLAVA
jgi:hypothetical protein